MIVYGPDIYIVSCSRHSLCPIRNERQFLLIDYFAGVLTALRASLLFRVMAA